MVEIKKIIDIFKKKDFLTSKEFYSTALPVILVLLLIFISLISFASNKANIHPFSKKTTKYISVTGFGSIKSEPDTALLRMGTDAIDKTASKAQSINSIRISRVNTSLKKLGINSDDVSTYGFYIYPETKFVQNKAPEVIGYRCSTQIAVTINDLKKVSKAIDAGINAGINNVQGIEFYRRNIIDHKRLALDKAVQDANLKAQSIAASSKMKLDEIVEITESSALVANASQKETAMGGNSPINPGMMEINSSVVVKYKVKSL